MQDYNHHLAAVRSAASSACKRGYSTYAADDFAVDFAITPVFPMLNNTSMTHQNTMHAMQIHLARQQALENLAWDRECNHFAREFWPSAVVDTNMASGTLATLDSTSGHSEALSPTEGMACIDFDHELEFELNSEMGMVWTRSLSETVDDPERPLSAAGPNFFPAVPEPSRLSGANLLYDPLSPDSPSGSAAEAIENLHRLGCRLQEDTRRQITNVANSPMA